MIILAIETSCDETSVSITKGRSVLSNITVSQIFDHVEYGGVVPNLAAKLHLKNIGSVFQRAIKESGVKVNEIEYIAYTSNPGLVICLQIGKIIAETLSLYLEIPLIPCNHLLGHAYATLVNREEEWKFPALALIISGGHTQLYLVKDHLKFELLGETLDDAVGECLDKSAIVMGYRYPGGPIIESLSRLGKPSYSLPFPKCDKTFDFSFSGLKSEIRRIVLNSENLNLNDLSMSILEVISTIISKKIRLGLEMFNIKSLIVGGGVIANNYLRSQIKQVVNSFDQKIDVFIPNFEYSTDNAAMIGTLAYYKVLNSQENI